MIGKNNKRINDEKKEKICMKYKVVLVSDTYIIVDENGWNKTIEGIFTDVRSGDEITITFDEKGGVLDYGIGR